MYTYYLSDDKDTIYKIKLSLDLDSRDKYITLLKNYLRELVFVDESNLKKLIDKDKIEEENGEDISSDDYFIYLSKRDVIDTSIIEDYLPYVVTVKTTKCYFLRSYTICVLIGLLSNELKDSDNQYVK